GTYPNLTARNWVCAGTPASVHVNKAKSKNRSGERHLAGQDGVSGQGRVNRPTADRTGQVTNNYQECGMMPPRKSPMPGRRNADDAIDRGLGKLADAVADAAQTARNLLAEAEGENVRLAAEKLILEQAVRLSDAAELEERIRALEERPVKKG